MSLQSLSNESGETGVPWVITNCIACSWISVFDGIWFYVVVYVIIMTSFVTIRPGYILSIIFTSIKVSSSSLFDFHFNSSLLCYSYKVVLLHVNREQFSTQHAKQEWTNIRGDTSKESTTDSTPFNIYMRWLVYFFSGACYLFNSFPYSLTTVRDIVFCNLVFAFILLPIFPPSSVFGTPLPFRVCIYSLTKFWIWLPPS